MWKVSVKENGGTLNIILCLWCEIFKINSAQKRRMNIKVSLKSGPLRPWVISGNEKECFIWRALYLLPSAGSPQAQQWEDLPDLGEWGGPHQSHLHGEGRQHEESVREVLQRTQTGDVITNQTLKQSSMMRFAANNRFLSHVSSCGLHVWFNFGSNQLLKGTNLWHLCSSEDLNMFMSFGSTYHSAALCILR